MVNLDISYIRSLFPVLERKVAGKEMVYLDNSATTQTPVSVVKEIERIYFNTKANVHRGVHSLSQEMTDLQEKARENVRAFINAGSIEEIVFTSGTTESINLVASSYGQNFKEGDEVILTVMEHHANIVPWQLLREKTGIVLKVVEMEPDGSIDMAKYRDAFSSKTVLASFCHVSNVLGTENPIKEMTAFAHSKNVKVLVDGAQAISHINVDVKDIDCDFYVFSAHKMYGPTGVGVLFAKKEILENMPPYQGGGEMISKVTFEHTTFADLPFKFEAGTPDFVGIAAFSKAMDFMKEIGVENISRHEYHLLEYAQEKLRLIPGLTIFGNAKEKCGVISFLVDNIHPYDLGMLLDKQGIEVRTGHHCAMPLMDFLNIPGTVRASFAIYNTEQEVETFVKGVERAVAILR